MPRHFPGLNALRFYLALSVIVDHTFGYQHLWDQPLDHLQPLPFFFLSGFDAVNFFFVLSGFLIMYLLLAEQKQTQTVNVEKFYLRRILRIWPLYFLIIGLAVFILPLLVTNYEQSQIEKPTMMILIVLFGANFAHPFLSPFNPLKHLWSIAVEEQFYLIAPHLLRQKRRLILILATFTAIMTLLWIIGVSNNFIVLVHFLEAMRYQSIAIGCLFAILYFNHSSLLKWLYHPVLGYGSVFIVACLALTPLNVEAGIYTLITSLVYAIVILNIGTNDKFRLKPKHPIFESLGNLSFGMYMYHPLVLNIFFANYYDTLPSDQFNAIVHPIVITTSILIAWLSYRYVEKPFLRLKDRFKPSPTAAPDPAAVRQPQLGESISS